MKTEFKVGDRVVVYDHIYRNEGIVTDVDGDFISAETGPLISRYHRKQCRRLIPRKKRSEIWVYDVPIPGCYTQQMVYGTNPGPIPNDRAPTLRVPIKFIEAKNQK